MRTREAGGGWRKSVVSGGECGQFTDSPGDDAILRTPYLRCFQSGGFGQFRADGGGGWRRMEAEQ